MTQVIQAGTMTTSENLSHASFQQAGGELQKMNTHLRRIL